MSVDRGEHLGIVELGEVCAAMAAASLDLFGELGVWVTSAPPGPRQRWYATACHRHAWHAELWQARSPAVPAVDHDAAVSAARRTRLPTAPDEARYRAELEGLVAVLGAIDERVDPDLDPATTRVITLVRNDLAEQLTA
jgi:hypothetical protein